MNREMLEILGHVPLFDGMEEEHLERLGARAEVVALGAGEWLFHAGDAGDALYVVTGGRVEIVLEGPPEVMIRELGTGDALGELALLTGASRSAGARARRDSALLRIARDEFEAVTHEADAAMAMARFLAGQLQSSRGLVGGEAARPSVIGVLPLTPELDADAVASALLAELALPAGSTSVRFAAGDVDPIDRSVALDRLERAHDFVVLVADGPSGPGTWADFCTRQSDTLVLLGGRGDVPAARPDGADPRDLHLITAGTPSQAWLDAFPRATVSPVSDRLSLDAAAQVIARRSAGRSVGVVLSGGGARGMAHIGMLAVLEEAGVRIDRVGGCSMGASVGALYAQGRSIAQIREDCVETYVRNNPLGDYTLPVYSIVRGHRAREAYIRLFGEQRFEEQPREFFCVTSDLAHNELVVHRRGTLVHAVGASASLPGILPPVAHEGRLLCDGGVMNNLPVDIMAADNHGPVIALDVTATRQEAEERAPRFRRPRVQRYAQNVRRLLTVADHPLPSIAEVLFSAVVLGSADTAAAAREHAALTITPDVQEIAVADFTRMDDAIAAGRAAAEAALDSAPASLFPPA
jgi:NTE family protein